MKVNIMPGSSELGRKTALVLIDKIGAENVIMTARSPEKLKSFLEKGVEIRYGDYKKINLDKIIITVGRIK